MAETFEEEQKSQEAGCASRGKSGAVRGRWDPDGKGLHDGLL